LRLRGQAVLNDSFGAPDANRHILVAHAERAYLDRLREELWRQAAGKPPTVFVLDAPANLPAAIAAERRIPIPDGAGGPLDRCADGESRHAWLGLPTGVDGQPVTLAVRPEPGAGLVVLGDDATTALGVLTGVAVTLALTAPAGDSFVVFDLLPDDPVFVSGRDALLRIVRGLGFPVEVVGRTDVVRRAYGLRDTVEARDPAAPPVHVIMLGMHRAVRMTVPPDGAPDSPADALRDVAADGPAVGVYLYGWWNRLKPCRDQLGYDPPIGTFMFLRHPSEGVRDVCGPFTRWTGRPHRGLVHDGLTDEPRQVVTFEPIGPDDATLILGHRDG
jgi:hypothetical protein